MAPRAEIPDFFLAGPTATVSEVGVLVARASVK
jgi:hypothetical protein